MFRMYMLLAVVMTVAHPVDARDYSAGFKQLIIPSPERGTELSVTVWYPALPGGRQETLGENPLFAGTEAMRDAPVPPRRFPLILLSHGAGLAGRAEAMSWIATPLAKAGYIVAAPTHPANTGPKRSAAETVKLWLRPGDLSATLDAFEKGTPFQQHISHDRIGVLGLSLGGNTALLIAGARLDPDLFANYCTTGNRNTSLCDWLRLSGVDLHAMDRSLVARSNEDDRIRFAIVIDAAPVDIFVAATLRDIRIPVSIVNLGVESEIPETLRASGIANIIHQAEYQTVEDASHASMFPECKPGADRIAIQEGIEDPICTDGNGRSREAIHTELIGMVTNAIRDALAPGK